ncbi:carbohydrate ABC transporter permease [Anaeromicropila herbilytica]|uniref:carbohydrate ABC transporter permease n=1 Tax=Anaeromicropila herbilytica TaxID=2785025 RepID=UPI00232A0F2E|nr:carbohydrate ABC transporter permease [Anaeromicropila herbilytica]
MKKNIAALILLLFAFLIIIPLWMVISGSFIGKNEITRNLAPVLSDGKGKAFWPILPQYPTFRPYIELLLDSPAFFAMFWNSCKQVIPILIGQLLIGVPAAWAFARFEFPLKKIIFTVYITLMIMPFQVTMVSSYLVLDHLKLLDTNFAIILPAIFATFPVFIMMKFFSSIPADLFEAAEIDGANEWNIFIRIGIPLGNSGIMSALVLGFLEQWNAIEPPLTFLDDKSNWPLSLYLPNIATDNVGVSLAASVIMMLPALLIFLFGQSYLEDGIKASGLKE